MGIKGIKGIYGIYGPYGLYAEISRWVVETSSPGEGRPCITRQGARRMTMPDRQSDAWR